MAIRLKCPSCKVQITVDNEQAGKKTRCEQCNKLIAIPMPPAKKADVAIQTDRKLPVQKSRKPVEVEDDTDEEVPEVRSAKRKPAPRKGVPLALAAIAGLLLLSCLLMSSAGVAWFILRDAPAEVDLAQAKGEKKEAEKPVLKVKDPKEEKPENKPAPINNPEDKNKPNPDEKKKIPPNLPATDFNIAQVRKSVVFIKRITPGLITATGSGFIATKDGLIYTNRHVAVPDDVNVAGMMLFVGVPSAKDPDVLDYFKADLVYAPPEVDDLDFAILKITAKPAYGELKPLPMAFGKLELGTPAAAVGYPAITDDTPPLSFNKGSISAPLVKFGERSFYQTDAAVNPGNSGGPLINARGEVVGIVTLKKRDAVNMGYALYLSETTKAVAAGVALAPKFTPEAGPLDPKKKLPTLPAIAAKKANWHVNRGEIIEGKSYMEIDGNGTQYWVTSKESLPENFQLVIPCQIGALQGTVRLAPSQFSMIRTLAVRFGTDETESTILQPKGYLVRFSHIDLELYRDGRILKRVSKGNTPFPMNFIITKQSSKITVAIDERVLLEHIDDDPISAAGPFSIGGYLSRLRFSGVSIIKLDGGDLVAKGDKKDPPKEDNRPIPAGGLGNPAPKEFFNGDVTLRLLKFTKKKAGNFTHDTIWAKDGKSFYLLQEFGLIQRVNAETGNTEQFTELNHKCANLAMSGEGLLVSVLGTSQVWVLDPEKLSNVKTKISVPGISYVSCGLEGSVAWAGTPGGRGLALQAVDLRKGTLLKRHARWDSWSFAVSPDGKYIFSNAGSELVRFLIIDTDDLVREQTSYGIGGGNGRRICFSPDGKYVAMASAGGNGSGHEDHPALKNYPTYIYPVRNIRKAVTGYAAGGNPRAVGIDPKSGCLLAQNASDNLLVYSFSADFKLGEYPMKYVSRAGFVEFSVSPLGGSAIARTGENDIFHVKINKGGPPINTVITEVPDLATIDNPAPSALMTGDITMRQLTFRKPSNDIRNGIVWAKDAKSFYMLQLRGMLQRVNVATGKTEEFFDIGERCGNIAMSGEGLLVSLVDAGELWVLDPNKLGTLRKKITIPKLGHVSAGLNASIAFVSVPNVRFGLKPLIQTVDLKAGKLLSLHEKYDLWEFQVTPDGKYLFGYNGTELIRFRIEKDELVKEETSYQISKSGARPISFSPDSKYVVLPQPGYGNGTGYPDHPDLSGLTTYIYPVNNLKRPITGHVSGKHLTSIGIDPKTGCILGMNNGVPLILYSFAVNTKLGEYDFKTHRGSTAEFAVSPLGSEVIIRTDADGIIHVKINKEGPPVEKFLATDFSKITAPLTTGVRKNPDPVVLSNGDVSLRQILFHQNQYLDVKHIVWANDGKTFFMLHVDGTVQRVNTASGKTEQYLEIGNKCTNLAMSAEGLLVSVTSANQLWLVDPEQLGNLKKKIFVPSLLRVAAGMNSSIAWVSVPDKAANGSVALQAVDLKEGKLLGTYDKHDMSMFVVSADNKYIVSFDKGHIARFRLENNELTHEETSFLLSKFGERKLVASPDGKFVAMPVMQGNPSGHPDHPSLKLNATYVYAVENLKRPVAVYGTNFKSRHSLGIDSKGSTLLVADIKAPLKLYSFAVDNNIGTYTFTPVQTRTVEFYVSPSGSEALATTGFPNHIIHIKLNKKAPPPAEKLGAADAPKSEPAFSFRAHLMDNEIARNAVLRARN